MNVKRDALSLKEAFFSHVADRSQHTKNEYRRSIDRLYEFMGKKGIASIEDITQAYMKAFQEYLYKDICNS